jgi:hypothetical protein
MGHHSAAPPGGSGGGGFDENIGSGEHDLKSLARLPTLKPCAPKQGTLAKELLSQFWSWLRTEGFPTDVWNPKNFGTELKRRSTESERCTDGIRYGLTGGTILPLPPLPGETVVAPSCIPPPCTGVP